MSQQTPEHTSTLAFENYTTSRPMLSSARSTWHGLLVRTFSESHQQPETLIPAVPDPYLVLVTAGNVTLNIKSSGGKWRSTRLFPGTLSLTPAGGDPYTVCWQGEPGHAPQTIHVHIEQSYLQRVAEETARVGGHVATLINIPATRDPLIQQVMLHLVDELQCRSGDPLDLLFVESAAQLLAVHLLRQYGAVQPDRAAYPAGLSRTHFQRVIEYVDTHLDQDLSLAALAGLTGLSTYHFARLFKQSAGMSPHQYVLQARITKARQLLRETALPVAQIALATGFCSQSHLTVHFTRLVGVAPGAYRQLARP